MREDWTRAARQELLNLQGADGGWGYHRGAPACGEPTALAGLALLADGRGSSEIPSVLRAAADRLATLQRSSGSVGLSVDVPGPGWSTPYALLFWRALGTHQAEARAGTNWLLGQKGRTMSRSDNDQNIIGHDTSIVGWPWVDETHSWLEPTAMAVLALERLGHADHLRVRDGVRLVRDRAVESGGWNYGNKAVFGRSLRAQPGPTGLALLTLAGHPVPGELVARAIRYLRETLPGVRASASLGWGLIGLRAWKSQPEATDDWLAEAFTRVRGRADAAPRLSVLLLAAGAETLGLFGRSQPSTRNSHG